MYIFYIVFWWFLSFRFSFFWRPKNSPAKHGHRWPTAPLDESPPESNGKTRRNGHHDPETPPPPNQKQKPTRTHSHRLEPMWCGAGEVLGEGWRCGCNSRSCRAIVEKTGQRPPVGALPDENIPRRLAPTWCAARGTARGHKVPTRPGRLQAPRRGAMPGGTKYI